MTVLHLKPAYCPVDEYNASAFNLRSSNKEVIAQHDASNWTKQSAITDEPRKNVIAKIVVQAPRHNYYANEARDNATCSK